MIDEQQLQKIQEQVKAGTASHEDIMLYINIMKEAVTTAHKALKTAEEISNISSKIDEIYGT